MWKELFQRRGKTLMMLGMILALIIVGQLTLGPRDGTPVSSEGLTFENCE